MGNIRNRPQIVIEFIGCSLRHLQSHWTLHNDAVYHPGEQSRKPVIC